MNTPASAATPSTAFTSADVSAVWINRITIEVTIDGTKYTFVDGGGLNDDQDYKFQIQGSSCFGEISGFPSGFLTEEHASREVSFDIDYLPPDGECTDSSSGEFKKTIASPQNAMISFIWVSQTRIQTVDGAQGWFFSDDPASPELYFIRENESTCKDKLLVSPSRDSAQFFELDKDGTGGTPPPEANVQDSNCKLVQDPRSSSPETNNPPSVISTPLGNLDQNDSETELIIGGGAGAESSLCETQSGSFGWILCPLLSWASEAIEIVEGWISNKLELPSEYYDNAGVKGAWANVRNIAYFILIPIMLLMVISTALGFSVFDAYTVKRSLPRLFAAIIFMALSYEFATLLIEITNIVGEGVAGLIAAPFGGTEALTFQNIFNPNNVDSGLVVVGGGVILAGLGVAAFSVVSIGVLASYLFVAALALLSVFFLLIFRQTILIALIIAAPLAIVSWIFPGNDKMWKIWWQTFSKLLLLYPIVVAAIVTGRAFASIVATSETAGLDSILSILVVITAYIAPFFLIPTIFRYAGGAFANIAGIVNNRSKGVFDRNRKYRQKTKAQNWERDGKRRLTQRRADWQSRLQGQASKGGAIRRNTLGRAIGRTASTVGGYNIQAEDSEMRERVGKELNAQIATGRDEEIRGLTVDKRAANSDWEKAGNRTTELDSKGRTVTTSGNGLRKVLGDGTVQYKTLGGAWVNEAAVDEGRRRWGNDTYAQQTALSYEMRKAMTSEQVQGIGDRYASLAMQGWGMTENQATGAWIGAGFENQNQHLEFKNSKLDLKQKPNGTYGGATLDYAKFTDEVYEKKGSYPLAQMSGHTFEQLRHAYTKAQSSGDVATQDKLRAIAETFVQRGASGGQQIGQTGTGNNQIPIQGPTTVTGGTGTPVAQTYGSGSAHVNEEIRRFANLTGVYDGTDPAPYPQK